MMRANASASSMSDRPIQKAIIGTSTNNRPPSPTVTPPCAGLSASKIDQILKANTVLAKEPRARNAPRFPTTTMRKNKIAGPIMSSGSPENEEDCPPGRRRRINPSSAIQIVSKSNKLFGDNMAMVSKIGISTAMRAMWVPAAMAKTAPMRPVTTTTSQSWRVEPGFGVSPPGLAGNEEVTALVSHIPYEIFHAWPMFSFISQPPRTTVARSWN